MKLWAGVKVLRRNTNSLRYADDTTLKGTIKDRNGMDLTEAEDTEEVARIHRRTVQKRTSQPR